MNNTNENKASLIQERVEDLNKVKLEYKSLKTKLKREEDSRKHWQDISKQKEDELQELLNQKEELKDLLEKEKA
jgi:hypothetical protein